MTTDVRQGALEPHPALTAPATPAVAAPTPDAAIVPVRQKKSRRDERWERRRRRIWFEEILGWILVPAILLALYYIVLAVLGALGTSPAAIINGISAIMASR